MTDSFLEEYNGSLSWVLHNDGTICNGYSGINNINIHQNKCNRVLLDLDVVRK
jgi:hypothetical protein